MHLPPTQATAPRDYATTGAPYEEHYMYGINEEPEDPLHDHHAGPQEPGLRKTKHPTGATPETGASSERTLGASHHQGGGSGGGRAQLDRDLTGVPGTSLDRRRALLSWLLETRQRVEQAPALSPFGARVAWSHSP